jgi:hypothetical protein
MRLPGVWFEVPEGRVDVVQAHQVPASDAQVACIVTSNPAPEVFGAGTVDREVARLLTAVLDAGAGVACLEDKEGTAGVSGIVGPAVQAALRRAGVPEIGVDSLSDAAEMARIQASAAARRPRADLTFEAVRAAFLEVAGRWPRPAFARFLALATRRHTLPLPAAAPALLALDRQTGAGLPAETRRVLISFTAGAEIDSDRAQAEAAELYRRLMRHVELRLCSPDLSEAGRRGLVRRMEVGAELELLAPEVDARFRLRDPAPPPPGTGDDEVVRPGREKLEGGLTAIHYNPADSPEDHWTGRQEARRAQEGFNPLSDLVDQLARGLHTLFDLAEVLGIDSGAFPHLRRYAQQNRMLEGLLGPRFLNRVMDAVERAWTHLEARVCETDAERRLLDALRRTHLLAAAARLELTPEAYEELAGEPDRSLEGVLAELAAAGAALGEGVRAAARELDAGRDGLLRFYTLARQRARGMAARTVELAREHGGKGLLLCLGFHQPVVQAAWLAHEVSFVVVRPLFRDEPVPHPTRAEPRK